MEHLSELMRVSKSSLKAVELLNKTVIRLNEDALLEAAEILKINSKVITVGVKNTGQISRKYITKLIETKRYVWHTIDGMAEGGRAVDVNLINPITCRPMTGSSSATAVNVLYGINDVGIGTDGGGSVLAPALSLNLFSIMAKGMGLCGNTDRVSTDGISFTPGLGVISHSFELARDTILMMLNIKEIESNIEDIKVAICRKGNIILPDGKDMEEKLNLVVDRLKEIGLDVYEEELPDFKDRRNSIVKIKKLMKTVDMVITCEGPIDLMGLGDSVFGSMGQFAKSAQDRSAKYMVKIANMLNATCITIPVDEIASGIVITSRAGREEGIKALKVAEKLKDLYSMPELYYSYFKDGYLRRKNDIIFSLEGV